MRDCAALSTTFGAFLDTELKNQLETLFNETRGKAIRLCEYYGGSKDTLEIRHLEKLDRIQDAQTFQQGHELAMKAEDSVFISCLHLVASGKLRGANTPDLWEGKAAKADSLARYFEKMANDKFVACEEGGAEKMLAKAAKQRYRAEKIREYAATLLVNPAAPQPNFSEEEPAPAEEPVQKRGRKKAAPVEKTKAKKKLVGLAAKKRKKVN